MTSEKDQLEEVLSLGRQLDELRNMVPTEHAVHHAKPLSTGSEPSTPARSINNFRAHLPWPLGGEEHGAIQHAYENEKGETAYDDFNEAQALAAMILAEEAYIYQSKSGETVVCVDASDLFAWGYSAMEPITFDQIEEVYGYFAKDHRDGINVWNCIKHGEMPQKPVEAAIRKAGIWDLDALAAEHGLKANRYDGRSMVLAKRKYAAYSAWEAARGNTPLVFDGGWWKGWTAYTEAHPGWNDDAWKTEDNRLLAEWEVETGWASALTAPPSKIDGE